MHEAITHLLELRRRLLRYLAVLLPVFLVLACFSNRIYHLLALPFFKQALHGSSLIATSIAAPFVVPLKSALALGILLTVPYLLYQIWGFIAPALYQDERRLAWVLLCSSSVLFYVGVGFAYALVMPWVFHFLIMVAPVGVEVKPDIAEYFSFVLQLSLAFGFAFELPICIFLLDITGICPAERAAAQRPYVIIGAFVVGMLLTPPDVISQTLLALPLWLLFELGVLLARYRRRRLAAN